MFPSRFLVRIGIFLSGLLPILDVERIEPRFSVSSESPTFRTFWNENQPELCSDLICFGPYENEVNVSFITTCRTKSGIYLCLLWSYHFVAERLSYFTNQINNLVYNSTWSLYMETVPNQQLKATELEVPNIFLETRRQTRFYTEIESWKPY